MILKFTLLGLFVILILIITFTYYQNTETFTSTPNIIQGRYIKLQQSVVGCINLSDIKVYSSRNGTNIITPTMTVTQSTQNEPTRNFVDGNLDTIAHTKCTNKEWIQVDLGSMKPIYKIVITNRQDCCRERANGIQVQIFNNDFIIQYTSKPFSDRNDRTTFTDLNGNNDTINEYYSTFTLFPPLRDVFGDLDNTMDFGPSSSSSGSSSSSSSSGSRPTRNDVNPQVTLSESGYEAMLIKQRSDLLNDFQRILRNEILSERNMVNSKINNLQKEINNETAAMSQGREYQGDCYKGTQYECSRNSDGTCPPIPSTSSGDECYSDTQYRCPKNPDGTCPPIPDMSKYIKKDKIPCWGCSIDY